jgi:hypothetical protein
MSWVRLGLALAAVGVAAGCDRLALEPAPAVSAPVVVAEPLPDLRPFAGKTYSEIQAEPALRRYSAAALALSEAERARFEAGMTVPERAVIATGGGAEALVFSGCAISGCPHARSVLAIDLRSGAVFVGVSGQGASEELAPNDRLEALLRVTSPTMRWDDPIRAEASPTSDAG